MIATSQATDSPLQFFAQGEELDDAVYPGLYNISSRFMFRFLPRPTTKLRSEYLYLPGSKSQRNRELFGLAAQWNMAWEAAQLRQDFFADELQQLVPQLRLRSDVNVFLFPPDHRPFTSYLPLYMLIPREILAAFGLPPLRRETWPHSITTYHAKEIFPPDLDQRLSRAFAATIWPLLAAGGAKRAFSKDDSLVLLSHSLDFWLPHVLSTIQDRLRQFDFVEFENRQEVTDLEGLRRQLPDDVIADRCRMGGYVWLGKEDAHDALVEVVTNADRGDRLSSIVDAVRSNRVEEDFSPRWSHAREDFERKLYRKRSRIRVKFVELDKADLVVGPNSETTDGLLWRDFFSVLDPRERQVVVCLAQGATNLSEVAKDLGYANHSPVSKALARIRRKAAQLLE